MRERLLPALIPALIAAVVTAWIPGGSAVAEEKLPSKADASCLKCHKFDQEAGVFAGKLVDVSSKAKAIQLKINKDMEVVFYDDATTVENAESLKKIPKQEAVRVVYYKKDGKPFAKLVEVKKGIDVPKEQLIDAGGLAKLVALGPKPGKYVLVDSRPGNLYDEGHIPTSVSLPFFAFDKTAQKVLPKDKDITQIYYCAGMSCVLSPLSSKKAEKLGYTKVKVFRAGLPAWKKAGNVVVSNIAGLEGYNKAGASYILIDLRPKKIVEKGFIPNAVALPDGGLDALKGEFPKYKGAAIILYNQHGDVGVAQEAYKKIQGWGYKNVSVLAGGYQAWEKEGKQVAKGAPASKITYVRKLAPGEVDLAAFKVQLEKPSPDVIILDVRNASEAKEGALPSTINVPLEELEQRLSDIPKNKTVFVHCGTGARAEMAYNVLNKAGFKVKYLKARVDFDKEHKGKYTIED